MFDLTVNGKLCQVRAEPSTPLLYVLRNELQLNGAKFGCGMGQCGACTVILDGKAVFSCLTPVGVVGSRPITTVEGLGTKDRPSPLQASFIAHQAVQCGYCIAGMIMRAQALLNVQPHPDEAAIRRHMEPNLCRCGTHMRILKAIRAVSGMKAQ